jgi:membrane protein implicated in regulation of membrane protease activity
VWSKVIAGVILAILAAIWAAVHFDWWSAFAATWPVPRWLFWLLVLLIFTLTVLLYRARQVTLQKVRGEFESCKVELQKSNREATRLEEELKAEKASLQDCPQVFIELREYETLATEPVTESGRGSQRQPSRRRF